MKKQSGFAVVELVVVVVLVVAIAGVGYFVWHEHNKKSPVATTTTTSSTNYQSPSTSVPAAPQVNKASDLNNAMQALNQTNVSAGNTDSNQLSTQTAAF